LPQGNIAEILYAYLMPVFHSHNLFGLCNLLVFSAGCLVCFSVSAQPVSNATDVVQLKLNDYIHQVVAHNESIQAQMLEAEVGYRKERAEKGIFEPQLDLSAMREANSRTNNTEQQAAQSGQAYFSENNEVYDGGIKELIPLGGTIQVGANFSDLYNNVNPNPFGALEGETNYIWTRQYQTFVGASLTQPLLKDFGLTPTLASIRLAALDSDIAFQEYRKQLMLTLSRAEGAYWNLYFAQEQLRFFDESVAVAQTVLDDSRQKLNTGQGAELDVMDAQSGLALRQTKRNDAYQSYLDALGFLQSLTGSAPAPFQDGPSGPTFRVIDLPSETNTPVSYEDGYWQAFESNPDFLVEEEKMRQEQVRLGFAKNQVLPELDLKAAYGYNGLGATPSTSWQVALSQDFPSWSIGLELTVPLDGNIKGRNLMKAAQLSLQEAYLNLKGKQTEIANHLNIAIQKVQAWQQSVQSYEMVVHYNDELLKTTLQQLKAGTVDGHKALEAEADLLDARQSLANAVVDYQDAVIEVELTDGAILKKWNLDISRSELRQQTAALLHGEQMPPAAQTSPDGFPD
jgi:outer membrane protein